MAEVAIREATNCHAVTHLWDYRAESSRDKNEFRMQIVDSFALLSSSLGEGSEEMAACNMRGKEICVCTA